MFIEFALNKSKAVQSQNLESAEGFCSIVFQLGVCRNSRSPVILSPTIAILFNFFSCAMLSSNEIGSSVRRRIPLTRQSVLGRWQRWKRPRPPIHQLHQLHQPIMNDAWGGWNSHLNCITVFFRLTFETCSMWVQISSPASLSSLPP